MRSLPHANKWVAIILSAAFPGIGHLYVAMHARTDKYCAFRGMGLCTTQSFICVGALAHDVSLLWIPMILLTIFAMIDSYAFIEYDWVL